MIPGRNRTPQKKGDLSDMYTKADPTKSEDVASIKRKIEFLRRGCPKTVVEAPFSSSP